MLRRVRPVSDVLAVFVFVFVLRYLLGGFVNDSFMHMSEARQIFYGELPIRDFFDAGFFLQVLTSYLLQCLFGYSLFAEYLFSIGIIACSTAMIYALARSASGSRRVGFVAAVLAALCWPRLYSYPKVLFYVLALALFLRYERAPSTRSLGWLALATAVAFLYRHDHAIYIGLGALALITIVQWRRGGPRRVIGHAAWYGGACLVLLTPFLAFVQLNAGLAEYVAEDLAYAATEAARTRISAPQFSVDPRQPLIIVQQRPNPPVRVQVRWQPSVSGTVRANLEARYNLTRPQLIERSTRGELWQYEIASEHVVRLPQLAADPRVRNGADLARWLSERGEAPNPPVWARVFQTAQQLELRLLPGFLQTGNAVAWLYYLDYLIPLLAVATLAWQTLARRAPCRGAGGFGPATVTANAVLCGVALPALLRSPLNVRLADIAAPTAVLGAWLVGQWLPVGAHVSDSDARPKKIVLTLPWPVRRAGLLLGRVALACLLAVTVWSVAEVAELGQLVQTARFVDGPAVALNRAQRLTASLLTSPPLATRPPPGSTQVSSLAWYVNGCTRPTDRLLVMGFEPELFFFADRAFAGGRVFLLAGYHSSVPAQQRTLGLLEQQSVPIVLADPRKRPDIVTSMPLIGDYLSARYTLVQQYSIGTASNQYYEIYVDRQRQPTGVYQPLGLPCFS